MSYTPPASTAADFTFAGVYTPPASTAADLSFAPTSYTGVGAVTLDITAAATGAHGVAGAGAVTLEISAAASGEHLSGTVEGDGAVTLDITAAATGAHGVTGTGSVTLEFSAAAAGAHGEAGQGAATLTFTAAAVGVHERYEVRGEVRQAGVLVNRRVRAYRRDTGALVGEGDTVAGPFLRCNRASARRASTTSCRCTWTTPRPTGRRRSPTASLSVLAQDA